MISQILVELIQSFKVILYAILGMLGIFVAIGAALLSYKKYREAMFLQNPLNNRNFEVWYEGNVDKFDNLEDAAKGYISTLNKAAMYELRYGAQERKKAHYDEIKRAYHAIKAYEELRKKQDDELAELQKVHDEINQKYDELAKNYEGFDYRNFHVVNGETKRINRQLLAKFDLKDMHMPKPYEKAITKVMYRGFYA